MPEHLTLVWDAFWNLTGDRSLGFGVIGPIQWVAISEYADRHGISGSDEFERFLFLIKALDSSYREFAAEQSKKAGRD